MRSLFTWFIALFIVCPIAIGGAQAYLAGWPSSWRSANWGSSGVLPRAAAVPEAQVMILSTRTGRWKGIFAEHMSIVFKRESDADWTRYDVVGWGAPVRKNAYAGDAFWYGNRPQIAYQATGGKAAVLIPRIESAIARYPFSARGSYLVWPGPNSNTFVSWVVRHTPGFDAELPAAAIGKDWLSPVVGFGPAPSKTGYTVSLAGVLGGTVAVREGVELHLLGATIGLDPGDLALKLPALGTLSLRALF